MNKYKTIRNKDDLTCCVHGTIGDGHHGCIHEEDYQRCRKGYEKWVKVSIFIEGKVKLTLVKE